MAIACPPPQSVQIVVETPSPTIDYAAAQLQDYAKKLFGADWEVGPSTASAHPFRIELAGDGERRGAVGVEGDDSYTLSPSPKSLRIAGSNDRSVLFGVYELVRGWGVRFYLSGDVIPAQPVCSLPDRSIRRKAALKLRGAHPYPDFLAGPSSWDEAQFERYIAQLPKLGLNFLGFHQYTNEPYVDYELDGIHPRTGALETSASKTWAYGTEPVCRFTAGREVFPAGACEWGSAAALGAKSPDERYARAQRLMAGALAFASRLGLATAFGFEPLSIDPEYAKRAESKEGLDDVTAARVDGVFHAFPSLDYLWLFTDESDQGQPAKLIRAFGVIASAERRLAARHPGKRLMIGGWNIESTLRSFDEPSQGVAFSTGAIFTSYGDYDPWRTVEEDRWSRFQGMRHAHSIAAWCEYDGRLLAGLQPNVTAYEKMGGRMRETGSLGFFFLHWNTRLCDSNLEYLSRLGWEDAPEPTTSFYADYFRTRFGAAPSSTSVLALEELNKELSLGSEAFWLMGNEWDDGKSSWRVVADAVERLKKGSRLTDAQRTRFSAQAKQAGEFLSPERAERFEAAAEDFRGFVRSCRTDCAQAEFLANRVDYTLAYAAQFAKLSYALRLLLEADRFLAAGRLEGASFRVEVFARELDMEAWRGLVRRYAENVDDRGEKGVVVSLNQKLLVPLETLEKSLRPEN
jgi:hypothetical protein